MSDAQLNPSPHEGEGGEAGHGPDAPAPQPPVPAALAMDNMIHVDPYEGAWIRISIGVLVVFFIAIVFSSTALGFQLPGVYQRIDPATLMNPDSPFANPTLRELAPGKYELYIRAQIWSFVPSEVHIPAGSTVTFYATSQDVQHGVRLAETNVNMMILPGQISTTRATFNEAGTYNFICHEYCGMLHHTMYGRIIVDPAPEGESEAAGRDLFSQLLAKLSIAQ